MSDSNTELQKVFDELLIHSIAALLENLNIPRAGHSHKKQQEIAKQRLLLANRWEDVLKDTIHLYQEWSSGKHNCLPRAVYNALDELDLGLLQFLAIASETFYPTHMPTPFTLRALCLDTNTTELCRLWDRIWKRYQELNTQSMLFLYGLCDFWGPSDHCTADCQSCMVREVFMQSD